MYNLSKVLKTLQSSGRLNPRGTASSNLQSHLVCTVHGVLIAYYIVCLLPENTNTAGQFQMMQWQHIGTYTLYKATSYSSYYVEILNAS